MKQNTNTEAAETDQTTDSPAVVQQRLVLPPVLDACCSTKAFWFNKENPDALFMDKLEAGRAKFRRSVLLGGRIKMLKDKNIYVFLLTLL